MTKDKILVVEDDASIAKGIIHNLEYEGFELRHASHGQAAIPIYSEFHPDLIILDLMLPGKSGFEILKEIRAVDAGVQIIILSAKTNESDKVEGLKLGADDYVSKPFSLREFLARISSAMRRIHLQKSCESETIVSGDLTIKPDDKTVLRNGKTIKLTPKALELLIFFAQHQNRTYSREQLIENIWHDDYEGTSRTIDNFVVQIRTQIEEDPSKPKRLETVHGLGYRFIE